MQFLEFLFYILNKYTKMHGRLSICVRGAACFDITAVYFSQPEEADKYHDHDFGIYNEIVVMSKFTYIFLDMASVPKQGKPQNKKLQVVREARLFHAPLASQLAGV
jgi:hypothetical protein